MNIHTIILAAGQGIRMNTNLPKVMQPLGGQTLISHVINTAQQNSKNITVVVGHQKALLKEHIATIAFIPLGILLALKYSVIRVLTSGLLG